MLAGAQGEGVMVVGVVGVGAAGVGVAPPGHRPHLNARLVAESRHLPNQAAGIHLWLSPCIHSRNIESGLAAL